MVERASSTRSQYLPPTVESIIGSDDEDRRTAYITTSSTMRKPRRRHRASGGSPTSSTTTSNSKHSSERSEHSPGRSRGLPSSKEGESLVSGRNAKDSTRRGPNQQTIVATGVVTTAEATQEGSASSTPRVSVITNKTSHSRSNSDKVESALMSPQTTPDVFSFMEQPESPTVGATVGAAYWQRQEWLRRQAASRPVPRPGPLKAISANYSIPNTEKAESDKKDSPVSSDSGIGLDGEPSSATSSTAEEDKPRHRPSAARAAFAPLLEGISQRSSSRPQSSSSSSTNLETSSISTIGHPQRSTGNPFPRPIMHPFPKPIVHHVPAAIDPESPASPAGQLVPSKIRGGPVPIAAGGHRSISGYEHLAAKLSSFQHQSDDPTPSFLPVYRKFETLNQRLFLHLQDELVELEDELRQIDEIDARARAAYAQSTTNPSPESRRNVGSGKFDVLGRAFVKLGQYNQALLSYNKLIKNLDSADQENVKRLREWVKTEASISPAEAQYLYTGKDLLSLSAKSTKVPTPSQPSNPTQSTDGPLSAVTAPPQKARLAAATTLIAILVPILAFGVVASLYWRLVWIVAVASALMLLPSTEASGLLDNYSFLVSYVGAMALVAVVVH